MEFDDDAPLFKAPLPRKEERKARQIPLTLENSTSTAVDEILNTLKQNRKLEIEVDRQQRQELRNPKIAESWKAASPRFSPMLLDGLLVTAASLGCMIIMLMITHVDLLRNLANPDSGQMIYLATASVVLGVCFVYSVVCRVFLGYTPGEWAYDMRLGKPVVNQTALSVLQIVGRQALITVSGVILLPLIGAVIGEDLAGLISGTQLMRKS